MIALFNAREKGVHIDMDDFPQARRPAALFVIL
jgi:hypothetical protein